MNVPLVSHLGIEEKNENTLKLACHSNVQNHIGTIHAAAQFCSFPSVLGNANELSNGSGALAPPKRDEAKATIP